MGKWQTRSKAHHFLKAAQLIPGLDCFVSGTNRQGQCLVRNTIKCKIESGSLLGEVGRAVRGTTTPLKEDSGLIRIKGTQFNSSGSDGPQRNV